jgi:hypothetical protein
MELQEINIYLTKEIIEIASEESGVTVSAIRRWSRGEIKHNEAVPYIVQLCQKRKEKIEELADNVTLK